MAHRTQNDQPLTTTQGPGSIVKSCRNTMCRDSALDDDPIRPPTLTWIMFLIFLDDMDQILEDEAAVAPERLQPVIEAPYR
jgi:type I restriction enzyme M protein